MVDSSQSSNDIYVLSQAPKAHSPLILSTSTATNPSLANALQWPDGIQHQTLGQFMSKMVFASLSLGVLLLAIPTNANAQRPGVNQDEAKVPQYTLPSLLTGLDGKEIKSAADWTSNRRPEVLQLFSDHVYGNPPSTDVQVSFNAGRTWEVLEGKALRKEIKMSIGSDSPITATLLLTYPKSDQPVPCFVGYNFHGNHTTTDDANVTVTTSWVRDSRAHGSSNNNASPQGRGASSNRWPYQAIIDQGFGVATMYYGDIDPDVDDQFANGIHPFFYETGQSRPMADQWGSIGAWAWGLSRALDYLEDDKAIDATHVAVIGHSRLGKTSLWAGATDKRFWITISNDSGCGGAALNRRRFGETVQIINTNFPHWFCENFKQYNDQEENLPIDQHMLIALMAPRAVYVASASADLWADPKGEYLALAQANPAYELFDDTALPSMAPEPGQPVASRLRGYHLREGKHNITLFDWQQYLQFADRHLNAK